METPGKQLHPSACIPTNEHRGQHRACLRVWAPFSSRHRTPRGLAPQDLVSVHPPCPCCLAQPGAALAQPLRSPVQPSTTNWSSCVCPTLTSNAPFPQYKCHLVVQLHCCLQTAVKNAGDTHLATLKPELNAPISPPARRSWAPALKQALSSKRQRKQC